MRHGETEAVGGMSIPARDLRVSDAVLACANMASLLSCFLLVASLLGVVMMVQSYFSLSVILFQNY
jgi:hypothetical protein